MQIPIIIVDDEEIDRMIAVKRIRRSDWAGVLCPIQEAATGDDFIRHYQGADWPKGPNVLILMDINMPGRNGFETVQEMQRLAASGGAKSEAVVLMYTSSENPSDMAQAKDLDSVRGYIVKPFDNGDIETIVALFDLEKPEAAPEGRKLH